MDDEDFEVDATDLAKGDSGDLGDVDDGSVVDSRAGSLGHLRNVSFTTKAVMAPRTHTPHRQTLLRHGVEREKRKKKKGEPVVPWKKNHLEAPPPTSLLLIDVRNGQGRRSDENFKTTKYWGTRL